MYFSNFVPLECRVEARNLLKELVLWWFVDMKRDSLTFVASDELSITNSHARRNFSLDTNRLFFLFFLFLYIWFDLNNLLSLYIFCYFVSLRNWVTLALNFLHGLCRQ